MPSVIINRKTAEGIRSSEISIPQSWIDKGAAAKRCDPSPDFNRLINDLVLHAGCSTFLSRRTIAHMLTICWMPTDCCCRMLLGKCVNSGFR